MNENATKIQIVINTIERLSLLGTYENANSMVGIYRLLAEVRDDMNRDRNAEEETEDGREADAE